MDLGLPIGEVLLLAGVAAQLSNKKERYE